MPKNDGKTLKINGAQHVKNDAERETVVKNQVSRGSATELSLHQKMLKESKYCDASKTQF